MDFHTLPMSWAMPWRAMNHGYSSMDGGPWRDNVGVMDNQLSSMNVLWNLIHGPRQDQ